MSAVYKRLILFSSRFPSLPQNATHHLWWLWWVGSLCAERSVVLSDIAVFGEVYGATLAIVITAT
jgi:hypothetical protein